MFLHNRWCAKSMMGTPIGLRGQIKTVNPECLSIHCCLHRQVLAANCLPNELSNYFTIVVKIISSIKTNATDCRLFEKLCKDNDSEYNKLLHFTAVRWLSKGNSFPRVFLLKEGTAQFFQMKGNKLLKYLQDDTFLAVLAYFL